MLRRTLFVLASLVVALPALAAKHTWLGGSSNRISDGANWSGGAPAGDPGAELIFAADAAQTRVVNDIPNLRFKRLLLEQGTTLAGAPLLAADGSVSGDSDTAILCDIAIEGTLKVSGGIAFSGALTGSGGLDISGFGIVHFTGTRPNTYAGDTVVRGAALYLEKQGALAVPGTLRVVGGEYATYVYVKSPDQIADSAAVILDRGSVLNLATDETIGALQLAGVVDAYPPLPTLTIAGALVAGGEKGEVRTNLRLQQGVVEIASGRALDFTNGKGKIVPPDAGLTLHGGGTAIWNADYGAPTRIDGVSAFLRVPNSAVEVIAGSFRGTARSLTATGGRIGDGAISLSDVRLGPGATLRPNVELNGALELNDAALDLPSADDSGRPAVIVNNKSSRAAAGTFKGIPEGGVLQNRWRVSYRGGDGNDVTVTDLLKPSVTIAVTQEPKPAFVGDPLTLTATVFGRYGMPTGSVVFRRPNGEALGAAALSSGTATLQTTLFAEAADIRVAYLGDDVYSSSEAGALLAVMYRKPVITSFAPPAAPGGSIAAVAIRGANFPADSRISGVATGPVEVVSPAEIRTTLDLTPHLAGTTLQISVGTSNVGVFSDPKPFLVSDPQPGSPLRFEASAALLTVTPHAKSAWLTSGVDPANVTNFLGDDDGDGVVRWQWPSGLVNDVYAAVDLGSGAWAVRANRTVAVSLRPFPPHTFTRDATHFVLPLTATATLLWARPGAGAWMMDVPGNANLAFGSLTAMKPLGDSPAAPANVAAGDVMIAIPRSRPALPPAVADVFAQRLGADADDAAPGIFELLNRSINVSEKNKVVRVSIVRRGGASGTASVRYSTVDVNHNAGIRYVATSETLTFGPDETLKSVDIPLIDDGDYRGDDRFHVVLSDPTNGAALGEQTAAVITIREDDPMPVVDVAGFSTFHVVPQSVPTSLPVNLTLTGKIFAPVAIRWEIERTSVVQRVIFFPGQTTKTILVPIPRRNDLSGLRQLFVDLFAESPVQLKSRGFDIQLEASSGLRGIAEDVVVSENAGIARVGLRFDPAPARTTVMFYATVDDTAKGGKDYTAKSGQLVLNAGQTQAVIEIPIADNGTLDGDRRFTIYLPSADVSFERPHAAVVIADDELTSRPSVAIADRVAVAEGAGVTTVAVDVRLSAPSTRGVRVGYHTVDGSAAVNADYQGADSVLAFAPGETVKTIVLAILGDTLHESDRTFRVMLSAPENATLGNATAVVTIVDDDALQPPRQRPTH